MTHVASSEVLIGLAALVAIAFIAYRHRLYWWAVLADHYSARRCGALWALNQFEAHEVAQKQRLLAKAAVFDAKSKRWRGRVATY